MKNNNTEINVKEEIAKIEVAEVDEKKGIVFFGTCHCSGSSIEWA